MKKRIAFHSLPKNVAAKYGTVKWRRGIALVLVLPVVALILGLVVAFLNLAKIERHSAATFLASAETRQMADNAVGIVQSQINYATTRGSAFAWASQPGMIRTYRADGTLDTAYKLYSSASLTETKASSLGNDLPPGSGWTSSPAQWTDLNAPVLVNDRQVYPIIDPSLLDLPSTQKPHGFDVAGAPVGSSAAKDRIPLPVRWLYVLKNGQIVAATGSGNTATIAGASADNPVTGRVAFWTDDETCKVNLNTASVGAYWDTPHYDSVEERNFATSQPLSGEFQRYPGHPGMTSLSAVFPQLADKDILSTLTPAYQWGGSAQGTVNTSTLTQALNGGTVAANPHYSDVDELRFKPSHSARTADPLLSATQVDSARFFLSTSSRAPELNLFNLPRIACWPVATDPAKRSVSDRLLAFAATVGNKPYYFQRQSALSPTTDAAIARNAQLFSYLQYLTSQTIPGYGVRLADKFGIDRDQILTEIWDYIRSTNLYDGRLASGQQFTADNGAVGQGYVVPLETGAGGSLSRGFGRSVTLSELAFAFLCSADPVDSETGVGHPNANGLHGSNDPANNRTLGGTALTQAQRRIQMIIIPELFSPSQGNVVIRPKNIRFSITGLGGLTLGGQQLFTAASASIKLSDTTSFNDAYQMRQLGGPLDYRALIARRGDPKILDVPATRSPYPFISQFVTVPVTNPGNTVNPGLMTLASGGLTVTIETSEDNSTWHTSQVIPVKIPTPSQIPIPNLVKTGAAQSSSGSALSDEKYWWAFSTTRPWGPAAVSGGRLTNLIENPGSFNVTGGVATTTQVWMGTLVRESQDANYYTDVVRSLVPSHGDYRLIAGLQNVPDDSFTPLGTWSNSGASSALLHTLGSGLQAAQNIPEGSQFRRHFTVLASVGGSTAYGAGGSAAPDFRSDAPTGVLSALQNSGDFDNAPGYWPDGAYINKPDEGNSYTGGSAYFNEATANSTAFFSPNKLMPGPGMFGSLPTHVKRYAADSAHPELYAWRTLLFRKQPSHPNAVTTTIGGLPSAAPDHLLMDLFWMPTVEPYPLSGILSTSGKINLNYQIEPFTYVKRATGLYAAMEREKIPAVLDGAAGVYKDFNKAAVTPAQASYRTALDVPTTLTQFDSRFGDSSGRLFLSPTELCDLWLVPQGQSIASMPTFWSGHRLTGDNMREYPYTTLIPRLTTKSNTYTVHFRVQTLKPAKTGNPAVWNETRGTIGSEYRGSTTIERFIDPTAIAGVDFAVTAPGQPALDGYYRWRVLQTRQFAP